MNSVAVKKVKEGAYFVVDTMGYFNQITPFDVALASQTISSVPRDSVVLIEVEADEPEATPSK